MVAYTNAATLITEDYKDTEDLDGLFSGFDAEQPLLRREDLAVRRRAAQGARRTSRSPSRTTRNRSAPGSGKLTSPPRTDPTLQDPRCVFQILRRHYARYTPEMVEKVCGTPARRS